MFIAYQDNSWHIDALRVIFRGTHEIPLNTYPILHSLNIATKQALASKQAWYSPIKRFAVACYVGFADLLRVCASRYKTQQKTHKTNKICSVIDIDQRLITTNSWS